MIFEGVLKVIEGGLIEVFEEMMGFESLNTIDESESSLNCAVSMM